MSKEVWFLLAGVAVGAGMVLLMDQGQRLRSGTHSGEWTSSGAAGEAQHRWGVEDTTAGFEAMDEDDLETPYSGYSGT